MSNLEELLSFQIKAAKLPSPDREYKFCPNRRWRADFCWPEDGLICEGEGGGYTNGRHTRGKGFENDCEKYNIATILGFSVLRVTASHIRSGQALNWVVAMLKKGNWDE